MSEARFRIGSAFLVALAAAIFPAVRFGPRAGGLAFAIVLAVLASIALVPVWRRSRILAAPFPDAFRKILEKDVDAYRRLGAADKKRFEGEVALFLAEQNIAGPRGEAIDDELRVLVAASATIVAFGRPGFRYPRTRDVVVYDEAFTDSYEVGAKDANVLGMVHGSGPILFSARALRDGFANPRDANNVGLHEFAHVLDFEAGRADGVPGFMPWASVRPWLGVMHAETKRIQRHQSILRDYAATNEAEFFAVATEMFFEQPERMKDKHPALYGLLVSTYGQDLAGVERAKKA
jgi:Mlc titration factor MtfA (ptsG expression regulator)